jgi:hypothetical protein
MSQRFAPALAVLALAASLAACTSMKGSADSAAPAADAPREFEPWPPAETPRPARPAVASDPAKVVRLVPREHGWTIDELFEMVSKSLGISILYDSGNATFKQAKVEFVGTHVIQESDLFAWLQAVLSYRKLVLVPVGPKSPDGKQQWFVMDQADPAMKSRPYFIDESEVFDFADRDGLYVVTSLRVRDTVEPTRARNALSPLSTATAGIGRIQDNGHFLIVGDFAPTVAAMKHLLDRINAETPPSAAYRPPPPAPATPPAAPAPK